MNTAKHNKRKRQKHTSLVTTLYVIRGGLYHSPTKKEKRIEQFWLLCKAAFWSHEQFTPTEVAAFHHLIAAHFSASQTSNTNFHQLAQRVCLLKRYLNRTGKRLVGKPSDWLNIHCPNGLSLTKHWYVEQEAIRKNVPQYNACITLFADALLRFCEKPHHACIDFYTEELARLQQLDLQALYHSSLVHLQFLPS